jgi:hypothetical protein
MRGGNVEDLLAMEWRFIIRAPKGKSGFKELS